MSHYTKKQKNGYVILASLLIMALLAVYYDFSAQVNEAIMARAIPCFSVNRPVRQAFQVKIRIKMDGRTYPLDPTIGQDGKCLHDIFTTDRSGVVHIRSNQTSPYTLGDFFSVWKKPFSDHELFNTSVLGTHSLQVLINGKPVSSYEDTQLMPNQKIDIIYR